METLPFDIYDFFGILAVGFALIVGLALVPGHDLNPKRKLRRREIALLILGAYVLGQVASAPAGLLLEKWFLFKGLKSPDHYALTDACGTGKAPEPASRFAPPDKPGWVSCWLFSHYYKPLLTFPERERIAKVAIAADLTPAYGQPLFKLLRYHEIVLQDAALIAKLNTLIAKALFCRNAAFVILLVSLLMLMRARTRRWLEPWLLEEQKKLPPPSLHLLYAGIGIGIAFGLVYRYLFYFRQYSYELFSASAGIVSGP